VSRLKDICVDAENAASLARWWAETLGYRVRPYTDQDLADLHAEGYDGPDDDPTVAVEPIDEPGPTVWFNAVPEHKHVKNRLHLDILGDVDELVGRGATVVEHLERWTVMADPEGNEFCVFPDAPGSHQH
jgi:hypothetical protein